MDDVISLLQPHKSLTPLDRDHTLFTFRVVYRLSGCFLKIFIEVWVKCYVGIAQKVTVCRLTNNVRVAKRFLAFFLCLPSEVMLGVLYLSDITFSFGGALLENLTSNMLIATGYPEESRK